MKRWARKVLDRHQAVLFSPTLDTEWLWACTAYNLKRLVHEMMNLRRSLAALSA